jgi:hypothetical protein
MLNIARHVTTKATKLPITVQRHEVIKQGIASRVMLTIAGADPFNMPSKSDIEKAFAEQFDNKVEVASDSLQYASASPYSGILTCVVRAKRALVSQAAAVARGFKEIANNVFADEGDVIWEVADTGAAVKMLVRTESEDLESLLGARQSRSIVTAASQLDMHADVAKHTAVLYTDVASGDSVFAIATAVHTRDGTFTAFIPSKNEVASDISTLQVIVYSENNVEPAHVEYVDTASVSTDKALEYYTRLYGSQPEYLNQIEEILRTQAARTI